MKNKKEESNLYLLPFIRNEEVRGNISKLQYGLNMIQAKSIWELSEKGKGVNIAVIDSGCDVNHESLKDSIVDVRNFTDEDGKAKDIVVDRVGHGTHVIGTIVANGTNGVLGVAPEANIYVVKAIDRTGSGKLSWIVNAIYYAIDKKVDIISMSLGMPVSDDKLYKAIKAAIDKDILVVCAAGNEGDANPDDYQYSYPAAYVDVISVGAVDKRSEPASFTNANLAIDVMAPGVEIISTFPDNQFASLSGTSMATPHVTGSLALLINWSRNTFQRDLTEQEIYAQLIKHTKTLECARTIQGNGLIYLKEPQVKKGKRR